MKSVFQSHTVVDLKKEIAKTNIKGYSRLKKDAVVELMLKHKSRFEHIKMKPKKNKSAVVETQTVVEPKKNKSAVVSAQTVVEPQLKYKSTRVLPLSAKDVLRKIFNVNLKELKIGSKNISNEAAKRRRWLLAQMASNEYETKDWIEDTVPFMQKFPKEKYEQRYQASL
tara:strand:- start:3725 stop:4231 length:507 start_codon:yes stop_codon:yes gene_type:complete